MLRSVLLVLAGLGAAVAVAMWMQPSAPPHGAAETRGDELTGSSPSDTAAAVADLTNQLRDEVARRTALEEHVAELAAQLEQVHAATAAAPGASAARGAGRDVAAPPPEAAANDDPPAPPRFGRGSFSREEFERQQVSALTAGGFAPDRAEWLVQRAAELQMQALQAQYDATRAGRPVSPNQVGDQTLRGDLGDAEYEKYLSALGRPTNVGVRDVLTSSPAEKAGLKSGDQIVAYDGQRVFDMRDLNSATLKGTPGQSVVVDVLRNGQRTQITMPRGPIGIMAGFGGPGGGPGGFRRGP